VAHGNSPLLLDRKDQATGNQERVGDRELPCAMGNRYAVVGNKGDIVPVGEAKPYTVDGDKGDVVRVGSA